MGYMSEALMKSQKWHRENERLAVVVVDMTNDFVWEEWEEVEEDGRIQKYKGRLVAPAGKYVVDPIGQLIDKALGNKLWTPDIIYLQDEHTEDSEEIKSGEWPEHCMKGTPGANTVDELVRKHDNVFLVKKDAYNGFTNPELDELLKDRKISCVYMAGLVQEVCIKENAEGFLENGYDVRVVVDATVPFAPYEGYKALKEIEKKGAKMISLDAALKGVAE